MRIYKIAGINSEEITGRIKVTECDDSFIICTSKLEDGAWHSEAIVLSKNSRISGDIEQFIKAMK